MASPRELDQFLAQVQKRAFKQAVFAVQKDESALDIVQDAMIRLATKYGDRPANEFPMLFQRILQNAITDYFRREKVRNHWVALFSNLFDHNDEMNENELNPTQIIEGEVESSETIVLREEILTIIEEEIQKLPTRQREAFLMRYWHDMDVNETALAMQCSAGSVKTHCSRATHALAKALSARGVQL